MVDGDYAAAIGAAALMRSVILIESEVPKNSALRPVARGFDDEARLSHKQIAFLPFAAGAFREPNAFFGETAVELALGSYRAPVTMNRSTRSIGCGLCIR